MTTIIKERIELFIKNPLENGLTRGEQMELARIAMASLEAKPVRYLNKFSGVCVTLEQQSNAADDVAVYIPLYAAPPAPVVPETLPCPVHLVPGLHLGKGCKTETLLIALQRRAEYYAGLDAMTPEERAEHDASIEAFKAMLSQPAPVDKEFIPKNLDKALGVVGVALPESKEEFNFQIERWIQRLIDQVIRYADEFKEQPATVVPEEMNFSTACNFVQINGMAKEDRATLAMRAWNACRAAMLQGVEQPQNARQNIPENIPDGNSPAIPDGWIPVSERMPENKPGSYEYIVFESLNNRAHHDYWNVPDGSCDDFSPFWNHYGKYVTHWMPVPTAPEPETGHVQNNRHRQKAG
ncbi:DUF551 domain-containing protein [Salmonella enterica subsp. enterica]|uniref:DUF551 domain-containing protein n=1 Tax=Salmonella enterica TaxID=28901 RepID=UPI0035B644DF